MATVAEISQQSPFPWRYITLPTGQVVCIDASNREVPIFSILDLAVAATIDHLAKKDPGSSVG